MPIITLTTDWGHKDHYLGAVKGLLINRIPNVTIVDISHDIRKFDDLEASIVLRNSYYLFPKETIHILGVNSEASIQTPHVAIKYNNHYFIGADNGIFSMVFDEKPDIIIELDVMSDSNYFTFSTRDVFVKVAAMLSNNVPIIDLGTIRANLTEKSAWKPTLDNGYLVGKVVYIDSYDNVITNISESFFKSNISNAPFEISMKGVKIDMPKLHTSYGDVTGGELAVLIGTTGLLEIAINRGRAAQLLNIKVNDSIMLKVIN